MNEFWEQLKSAATTVSGVVGEYFDYDLKKEQVKAGYGQTSTGAGGYAGNANTQSPVWSNPNGGNQKNLMIMGGIAVAAIAMTLIVTRKG